MAQLSGLRCFHHPLREAAARCLECGRHFCRECVTEHDDRFLCAPCLRGLAGGARRRGGRLAWVPGAGAAAAGLLVAWFTFYALGRGLMALPEALGEGVRWEEPSEEEP